MKISIIGLGKLGLPISLACNSRGHKVVGIDNNKELVDKINNRISPINEAKVDELLLEYNSIMFSATTDYSQIKDTEITFVIVPTPSKEDNTFSNDYVIDACEKIGDVLADKDGYHLIVITSTVMPQSMEYEIKPVLERSSGKIYNKDFGLCYSPEFIALGSVIDDFLNPDFVLIGESDTKAGDLLEDFYHRTCTNFPLEIARMNFINAEIAKLSLNCFVTTKITFVNQIAQLCEDYKGADVDTVTQAIGKDSRIGTKYLKGATAFGGPCFPRDVRAISALKEGLFFTFISAYNQIRNKQLLGTVIDNTGEYKTIAIIGLSYKLGTPVTEESTGTFLVNNLKKDYNVITYDSLADSDFNGFEGLIECINLADTIVITLPYEFNFEQFINENQTIIDCWRVMKNIPTYVNYIPIGKG